MMKQNKYTYMLVLQGYYLVYGWEDISEADKSNPQQVKDLMATRRDYRLNEPGYRYRIISRRVLNPTLSR